MSNSILKFKIENSFKQLSLREKMYAYYMSNAAWCGSRIIMKQRSSESVEIFDFLINVFKNKKDLTNCMTPDQWQAFLNYTAQIFGNLGNYSGIDGSKIIPDECIPAKLVRSMLPPSLQDAFDEISDTMYASSPNKHGFFTDQSCSTSYHSRDITKEDAEKCSRFMAANNINPENTRLIKHIDDTFVITFAAVNTNQFPQVEFEDSSFTLLYGDYSNELKKINKWLNLAFKYAANDCQRNMIKGYIKSFETGDLNFHKDAQRQWIKDKSPAVETIVGFIESYSDPAGTRAEFELMVALTDKNMTAKYQELIGKGKQLISTLPCPNDFEKSKFNPDFTSINVLNFATPCIPTSINFKNIALTNIIYANAPTSRIPFIHESLQELFLLFRNSSSEMGVGLYELLGNVSVTSLGKICISLYLSVNPDVHAIFKHEKNEIQGIIWILWLSMCLAGLKSLEAYDEINGWQQAQSQAQFAILQVLLTGDDFVSITETGPDNLEINVNPAKINSVGIPLISKLLTQLTTDVQSLTEMYSTVSKKFIKYKKIVDAVTKDKPRSIFVQPNVVLYPNGVKLIEYEPTPEGIIQSFLDRN
jgi:dipeptidyl-peptidase-3